MYLLNILEEIPTFLIAGHETTRYTSSIETDKF